MSPGVRLGLIIGVLGFAIFIAPLVLPRSAFGELGHGDGMGLIGMHLWGAVLIVAGLVTMIVAAVFDGRKKTVAKHNHADEGEEPK